MDISSFTPLSSIATIRLSSTSSTNSWALDRAAEFKGASSYAVWTTKQTAGRGQKGREWKSEEGKGLTVSIAFFTKKKRCALSPIGLVASLSLRKALMRWPFSDLKIKWPNDLLAKGKKLAGILVETKEVNGKIFVVVGIGVNVLQKDLQAIGKPATSLFLETSQTPSLESVLDAVLKNLQKDLRVFLQKGFKPFQQEYNSHLQQGFYSCSQTQQPGLFGEIGLVDEEGRLLFFPENAEPIFLSSGEILLPT